MFVSDFVLLVLVTFTMAARVRIEDTNDYGSGDDELIEGLDGIEEFVNETTTSTPVGVCASGSKYVAHETDCTRFYVCENSKTSDDALCPQSMWFDPNNAKHDVLCNYPEVICAANNEVCDCATKYPIPPPDPLIEKWISCHKDNQFHLHASKVDCGRYFVCHNENVFRMECKTGFHYNPTTKSCDYAEAVNCKVKFFFPFK